MLGQWESSAYLIYLLLPREDLQSKNTNNTIKSIEKGTEHIHVYVHTVYNNLVYFFLINEIEWSVSGVWLYWRGAGSV